MQGKHASRANNCGEYGLQRKMKRRHKVGLLASQFCAGLHQLSTSHEDPSVQREVGGYSISVRKELLISKMKNKEQGPHRPLVYLWDGCPKPAAISSHTFCRVWMFSSAAERRAI